MDHELARYLHDHLAGSSGGLLLIQELAEKHDVPEAREFFVDLKGKVEADRDLLEDLLCRIGKDRGTFFKVVGDVAARVGGIKLLWEKVEPGKLGMFEALEMLAIGVQGKRLMWLALQEIAIWVPEWQGFDFASLELEAIRQRDGIEAWRIEAARDILADAERRTGSGPHLLSGAESLPT
ncbi:MAG: hypothetical protein EOP88_00730 [Verrucomicrobiaceae bacterium]|nr:MAG: hypothetical protein EOP88_00730 [Verrucomicrobiaceae bacterium]